MAAFSIGGITIVLEGGDTLERVMMLPGMVEFSSDARSGAHICLDSTIQLPQCRLLHSFDIADGSARCRFGVDAEGVYYYDFGGRRLLRYDAREPQVVDITSIHDATVLRFALWTAYGMIALPRRRVAVHSSSVVCDGRAVMCLGESGTGKSTHTRLWLENIPGTHLLNDDSPILAVEGDELVVYGSPWSGKTHCYRQERVPVAALLRLEQRPENSIRRLGTVEAFSALQPSCPPCMAREDRLTDMLVDFLSDVLKYASVYRMGCLPDTGAANLSYNTVFGKQ
jgi:hypothetical protein